MPTVSPFPYFHAPGTSGYRQSPGSRTRYAGIGNSSWQNPRQGMVPAPVLSNTPGSGPFRPGRSHSNPFSMGQAPGAQAPNPYWTLENTKSQEIESRLPQQLSAMDRFRESSAADVGRYSDAIRRTQPQAEALAAEEMANMARYFNGDVAAQLDALRGQRRNATETATQRALGDLKRLLSLERLGSSPGGAQAMGTGSYLQKLALDKSADLHAQAGIDDAIQARADYDALERARLGMSGQRQMLSDRVAQRMLLPMEAQAQQYGMTAQQLRNMLATILANRFYGVASYSNTPY